MQIHILHFCDKRWYHIFAKIIQWAMKIQGLPKWNHTAICFPNAKNDLFVFEILGKGTKASSFNERKTQYKGLIHKHTIEDLIIPAHYNIYSVFEPYYDFQYSVKEAIASVAFKKKPLSWFNPILKTFKNPNNQRTYCTAILKALEKIEADLGIKIALLDEIRKSYTDFESITPGDLYLICDRLYKDSLEGYVCK